MFLVRFIVRLVLFVVALAIVVAGAVWLVSGRGFSAREQPSAVEESVASRLRSLAMARDAASKRNPIAATPGEIREGMAHFADHCAVCHGNEGDGTGAFAAGLYPKPPDLRDARTQSLSDGELFYVIENGIRFTGMPAFGGQHPGDTDSWRLVLFIRHLPKLTAHERAEMKRLNPVSPAGHEDHER